MLGWMYLGGVKHTREESGADHTEVVLTGNVPKRLPWALTNADPWRGSPARGNGRPSSKTPAFNIRVVQRPFHAQRGGEFLGLEPA
jgi:hypothetical protein